MHNSYLYIFSLHLYLFILGEHGTFDFAFIDADKGGYDTYYELTLKLLRPGGVISFDNTLLSGQVLDESNLKPPVVAIRKLNDKLKDDLRVNISFFKVKSICFSDNALSPV